jgi:hypothetical protein
VITSKGKDVRRARCRGETNVNNKRKLGAAFISLAVSGFAGLMLVAPGALAGGVVGTVLTEAKCDWQIVEIPATFQVGSAGNARYTGAELELSVAAQDLNIYVSGRQRLGKTESGSTPCIFYENADLANKTRPKINMSIAATKFLAEYQVGGTGEVVLDPTMDVELTVSDPLVITMGACSDTGTWTSTSVELGADAKDSTVIEILEHKDVSTAQGDDGLRCANSYGVSFNIPKGTVPTGAGEEYSFRGITLTTTLNAIVSE